MRPRPRRGTCGPLIPRGGVGRLAGGEKKTKKQKKKKKKKTKEICGTLVGLLGVEHMAPDRFIYSTMAPAPGSYNHPATRSVPLEIDCHTGKMPSLSNSKTCFPRFCLRQPPALVPQ